MSLSTLARASRRKGPKGAHALRELQAELKERYGSELRSAIASARREAQRSARQYGARSADTTMVVYAPSIGRDSFHWPFLATSRPAVPSSRTTIIWDSKRGWNTHYHVERARLSKRLAAI